MAGSVRGSKTMAKTNGKLRPKTRALAEPGSGTRAPSVTEVAEKIRKLLQLRVAIASGRAMAAVLLDKPEDQVTDAEAEAAHADHVGEHDEARQGRVIRAGWRAASAVLEREGLLPGLLPVHLEMALAGLDKGEARGMVMPSPAPKRSKKAAARIDDVRLLALYVHQAMGFHNISREHALVAVTGLPAGLRGRKYPKVMEPTFSPRIAMTYDTLSKRLAEGEKALDRATLEKMRAVGAARRDGTPLEGKRRGVPVTVEPFELK